MKHHGHLFIISGPSGVGKTTIRKALLARFDDLVYSVSYTTRLPRKGETDKADYCFISKDEFTRGIKSGKWAEWAEVHDNYYGTSADFLARNIEAGRDILLELDVQGTRQLLKIYPDCITFFIIPPSPDALQKRLGSRNTDTPEVIAKRLKNAEQEIARKDLYKHVIVNDNLDETIEGVISFIKKYRTA